MVSHAEATTPGPGGSGVRMSATTVTGSGSTPTTKTITRTGTTRRAKGAGKAVTGRGMSPEQRAARLAEVHEQLAEAVAAAATDAGWRAWLGAAARFREYSPTNQLLILLQRPGASRVAGYRVWQGLGRQVRKGERGITILAPVRRRTTTTSTTAEGEESTAPGSPLPAGQSSAPTGEPGGGRVGRALVGFTAVTVFDLAQTDGDPLPEPPPMRLAEGEATVGLWDGLVEQVEARGFTVGGEDPAPALGVTRYATRTVDVAPDLSPAMACHVLAHELGHIAADHETRRDVARGVREAEADGIAHLITTAAGLPGHVTVDYVTGWANGDPAIVRATAARVVTAAAQIIDAIHLDDTTANTTETQSAEGTAGSGQLEGVTA